MLHKNRLFTPGPTPLLPGRADGYGFVYAPHHRTADFRALFQARPGRHEGIHRHEE